MASSRKSRAASKRLSKLISESPDKSEGNSSMNKRKRKLSDMLGSQWSKEEIERFYGAYRKHGKDWKKVAGVVSNRSPDMVDALFNMNKAYLSLPEGATSSAGLVAMMTDHYNFLDGSDSNQESNDVLPVTQKPQKRSRGNSSLNNISKGLDRSSPTLINYGSATTNNGCLSLLKKTLSGDRIPRAVGKRTPRFPVSYSYSKEGNGRTSRQNLKLEFDSDDSEVAHAVALTLAEAAKMVGSPQMSSAPGKRTTASIQNVIKKVEAGFANARIRGATTTKHYYDGSLGSRGVEDNECPRDRECGTVYRSRKEKNFQMKNLVSRDFDDRIDFNDVKEACSSTDEGLAYNAVEDEVEAEVTNARVWHSPQLSRKRTGQLFSGDESTAVDVLRTLSGMPVKVLGPTSTADSESSVPLKGDKDITKIDEKPHASDVFSTYTKRGKFKSNGKKDKMRVRFRSFAFNDALCKTSALGLNPIVESKQQEPLSMCNSWKRKKKHHFNFDIDTDPLISESFKTEVPSQWMSPKRQECSSSTEIENREEMELGKSMVHKSSINLVNLPAKSVSRRKMHLKKILTQKERHNEFIGGESAVKFLYMSGRVVDTKNELAHCLSSPLLRRWSAFEWFYSAIDFPWFAKNEFVEYLNHAKLGSLPSKLTHAEWGVIRSALGKPRRLSEQLLLEERKKLEEYREHVRVTYAELRAGVQEGLPTDLARPLSVGQRVIAWHPKTRELHDGSVLTVDHNKYRIQFDMPELGVELVMDVDCMPLNPLENVPKALRMQNFALHKFHENYCEMKESQIRNCRNANSVKCASSDTSQALGKFSTAPNLPFDFLMRQAKGTTLDAVLQAKATICDVVAAQASSHGPCQTLAQIQARNADNKALMDLSRALGKKVALLSEMKNLHEEAPFSQNQRGNFREYSSKLVKQLKNVDDQVSSTLDFLKQRYSFCTDGILHSVSGLDNDTGGLPGNPVSLEHSSFLGQDVASCVAEIYNTSKRTARLMVDVEAEAAVREGNLALKTGENDSSSRLPSQVDTGAPSKETSQADDPVSGHSSSADQDEKTSCTLDGAASDTKQNHSSNGNKVHARVPLDLMSSCVATLLMIQTCTEHQYPPGEVAQILESAVTSLHPCSPENLPLYRDIEQYMGVIKTQVLALVPTHST